MNKFFISFITHYTCLYCMYIPTLIAHHGSGRRSQLQSYSMTRQRHHATTKSPWQRHHQHDLAVKSCHDQVALVATSYHNQCRLSSAITSRTRQCHRQQDSAAPSPAWLDSAITSMTQQHHCQHDSTCTSCHNQVASAASLPVWLDSIITKMTQHLHCVAAKSPQQRNR
jgi:hypothetical protein